jgi:hypothetical protein
MRTDAGDTTGARSALRIAQKYARLIAGEQKSFQASHIAEEQARAGDIAGAQETARLISDKVDKVWKIVAARAIVVAQAEAGDFAGAQKTADATGDPVETNMAKSVIATAQAKRASSTQATTPQPTPPQKAADGTPAALPAISAADWIRELDALNTPLFLDLPGSVKAPQQAYKTMYPGSSIDPKETDTKRTFKALVAIAQNIISANNTVDEMLKRQFGAVKP